MSRRPLDRARHDPLVARDVSRNERDGNLEERRRQRDEEW
jgi:hypothetical protein